MWKERCVELILANLSDKNASPRLVFVVIGMGVPREALWKATEGYNFTHDCQLTI